MNTLTTKKNYQIIEFFFLAYFITWLFWLPLALASQNLLPFNAPQFLFLPGAFGPLVSSLIISYKYHGLQGIKSLLGKLFIVKLDVRWYLFSFFVPFAIVLAVLLVLTYYGSISDFQFNEPWIMAGIFFSSFIVCANEEIAWRGFALPRFQQKHNALMSSLILGCFWGLIHFPLFLIQPGRSGGFPLLFIVPGFITMCIFLSIIYTHLYNSTRGSILIATIFHTSLNTANELYSSHNHELDEPAMYIFICTVFAVSLFIITKYGTANLSLEKKRIR